MKKIQIGLLSLATWTLRLFGSVALLIIVCTVVRCILAHLLNLGNDEVYYFTYAVQPDWNHFDHPPLVGLFIRLSTLNLHWINEFSMRLPAIAGAAINTWLIAICGQSLGNKQTGFYAAILYNTSIYTGVISGLFILPDSIQVVFWLAATYCMLALTEEQTDSRKNRLLIMVGLWVGLAILCKVHGIFLWVGFIGFMVFNRHTWLKNPYLYASMALTAAIFSPIFFWNVHNQFISWTFHSGRVEPRPAIDWISFLRTTLGQIAYQNPVNVAIFGLACFHFLRTRHEFSRSKTALLFWLSGPIILSTTLISLFRQTLPHWSGPGFIALILLGACYLSSGKTALEPAGKKRLVNASAILMTVVLLSGALLVKLHPGSFSAASGLQTGAGDATLDLSGWEHLKPSFEKIRDQDIHEGRMRPGTPIVTNKWFPGGHIYFYVAYRMKTDMIGVGSLNDLHKFSWLNKLYAPIAAGASAYYITPSTSFTDPAVYKSQFKKIELAAKIPGYRNGKVARYWYVYRLENALTRLPADL